MRPSTARFTSATLVAITAVVFTAQAQPHYVELGSLPVPTATERTELFNPQTRTWFSFPSYNQGDLTGVYKAAHSENGNFIWVQTTSFSGRTTYWGRGATDGKDVYFTGTIDNVSKYAPIQGDGTLGAWQDMTGLPTPASGRGRALHQAFVYSGRLYVIGGWYGDGLPAYADVYTAQVLNNGAIGAFTQTTSLPVGVVGHSATVSPDGKVYIANFTNLFLGRISTDGSVSSWAKQVTIPGMNHNNYGNVGIALLSNRLVIVDAASTFICRLDDSGQVIGLETTIANPATFAQRSTYTVDGQVFVAATTGKLYRIDELPPSPVTDFQNGSFEVPGQAVLGAKAFLSPEDSRLPGWMIGGKGGAVHLFNGGTEIYPALDGVSHLLFNGGGGAPGTWIAQTFKTEVGTKYVVGFAVGRLGAGGGTLSIKATARSEDGTVLGTLIVTPQTQGYGPAQKLRFTAISAQTTLEFLDTSSGGIDSQDITLDAVSVLPEPGLTIRVSSVEICWESEAGKSYQVQYRSALTGDQWVNLNPPVAGDGTRQCINDAVAVGSPRRFYQLVTTP